MMMYLHKICGFIMMITMTILLGICAAETMAKPFDTVGLYVWRDSPDQHAFWKASGIDTLQFCDTGWNLRPDLLDEYYREFAHDVDSARNAGFAVYVIIFSNIKQWPGPDAMGDGLGLRFHPQNAEEMEERLAYIRKTVRALKAADGFTFFAGDPGGVPTELGQSDVDMWMSMARQVRAIVGKEAPRAVFNVNTWSITQWQYYGAGAFGVEFWQRESELTKRVIDTKDLIGPDIGIEIPPHNYYRSLTFKVFDENKAVPKRFPTANHIKELKERGTRRIWAWPYFLLDEADDGYINSIWMNSGMLQIETRYIHKLVKQMREVGMTGIIGSWSWSGYLPNALNTYAFGRFATDPDATPDAVIDEYAGYIADDATKGKLSQILKFVENHSTWHESLPQKYRLPALDSGDLSSAYLALIRLDAVNVRDDTIFPLPEPAANYLKHVRAKLNDIAAHERVPEITVDLDGGELIPLANGNWAGDESASGGLDVSCSAAADRACAVICTIPDTGYPNRLDIPVELRKDHSPDKIMIAYVNGRHQSDVCAIYWDDVLLRIIDAYSLEKEHIETVEIPLPDALRNTNRFGSGIHVISIHVKPTPFWTANYFKVDSILVH